MSWTEEEYKEYLKKKGGGVKPSADPKKEICKVEKGIMKKLIIPGELPTLNEIIALAKKGKGVYQPYNDVKQKFNTLIVYECKKQLKGIKFARIFLNITWYYKNKKQDPDNIAVGQKILLDGMVHAEIIENDGWKQIKGFSHNFEVDKENPRVEILISEV